MLNYILSNINYLYTANSNSKSSICIFDVDDLLVPTNEKSLLSVYKDTNTKFGISQEIQTSIIGDCNRKDYKFSHKFLDPNGEIKGKLNNLFKITVNNANTCGKDINLEEYNSYYRTEYAKQYPNLKLYNGALSAINKANEICTFQSVAVSNNAQPNLDNLFNKLGLFSYIEIVSGMSADSDGYGHKYGKPTTTSTLNALIKARPINQGIISVISNYIGNIFNLNRSADNTSTIKICIGDRSSDIETANNLYKEGHIFTCAIHVDIHNMPLGEIDEQGFYKNLSQYQIPIMQVNNIKEVKDKLPQMLALFN